VGDLIGQANVIDGDTIEIHAKHIRLWGIDAPESAQLCRAARTAASSRGSAISIRFSRAPFEGVWLRKSPFYVRDHLP
jgi:hypothetical protein